MKLTSHLLCGLGAAGLLLTGCADADPAVSGDAAAANAASPDTPVSSDVDPAAPVAGSDEPADCNAAAAVRFVGQRADNATRARLLEAVGPVSAVRWVRPGDATTEDYSPERLNVMLDAGEVIVSAHCG